MNNPSVRNRIYAATMTAARLAAANGHDLAKVAPPVGRLRDAFMAEYDREVARINGLEKDND